MLLITDALADAPETQMCEMKMRGTKETWATTLRRHASAQSAAPPHKHRRLQRADGNVATARLRRGSTSCSSVSGQQDGEQEHQKGAARLHRNSNCHKSHKTTPPTGSVTRSPPVPQRSQNGDGDRNPRRRPLDQHTLILASFTSGGWEGSADGHERKGKWKDSVERLTRPLTMILLSVSPEDCPLGAPFPAVLVILVTFFTPPTGA